MPKIVLGRQVPDLPFSVTAPDVEGVDVTLSGKFKYRTVTQWAALMDKFLGQTVNPKREDGTEKTVEEIFQEGQIRNANLLKEIITSWDVEGFELTVDSLVKLCDEVPGIVEKLKDKYRAVCVEGKTGN